ncbi:MAG: DUF6427 family protein [Bacteroidota bacterium]
MIRLFTNTYNQTIVALVVFTVLIRLFGYYIPYTNNTAPSSINYLANLFYFLNNTPEKSLIISTGLILLSALILNNICIKHELVFIPSYLPALFYVQLNSLFPDQFYAGPTLFVNLFIILSIGALLNLYRSEKPNNHIFLASVLAGISALLNISYLAFFVFVIIGLNVFRPFKFKENISALIGFLIPIYMGTMINYLVNNTFLPFYLFFPDYGHISIQLWAIESALPAFFLVGVFAVIRMYKNYFRNTTKTKRAIQMLLILLILSLILMVTGIQNPRQEFTFVSIPLSIYLAFYFSNNHFNWLKESIHLILLLTILFFQYRTLLGY